MNTLRSSIVPGWTESGLRRFRLERDPLGPVGLRQWSGIVLGGGPFSYTEPAKSAVQRRVEADLAGLLERGRRRGLPVPRRVLPHRRARQPPGRGARRPVRRARRLRAGHAARCGPR